jgi:hypothetical protein
VTDVELLTIEYTEEVVNAGGARLMTVDDLAEFISELVLNNFQDPVRTMAKSYARAFANVCLIPEECKKRGINIDEETLSKLKESLR